MRRTGSCSITSCTIRIPRAFQSLVVRHGSAVHRVCRAVLKDPHEAEDVFQATFLVLARRAPDIQDPETLGGWLRGVAYRIAVRARRRTARRRENEKTLAEMSRAAAGLRAGGGDFRAAGTRRG